MFYTKILFFNLKAQIKPKHIETINDDDSRNVKESSCGLPVLTPHARNGLRFVLHISAVVVKQRFVIGRLLCG